MKTILINILTNQPASKVFEGGYKVDGKCIIAEELAKQGLIELEYIDTPRPQLTENQTASSEWQVTEKGYERVWAVREKTEQELAIEDWDCPEFAKRVEVPSDLSRAYPSLVTYAQVNPDKMEIVPKGDKARVYYNSLREDDAPLIKSLSLDEINRPY